MVGQGVVQNSGLSARVEWIMVNEKGMTKLAQAWLEAANDLGFEFVTPYSFIGNNGVRYTCSGLVKNIGSLKGTLIISRYDSDENLYERAEGLGFYTSGLSPRVYEKYNRERFMETLIDW